MLKIEPADSRYSRTVRLWRVSYGNVQTLGPCPIRAAAYVLWMVAGMRGGR